MPISNVQPAGDHLAALLHLLQDPQGFARQLQELQDARQRAEEAMAAVGTIEQIRALQEQAQRDSRLAAEARQKGQEEIATLKAEAKAELDRARDDAAAGRRDLATAKKALKDAQVEWEQRQTVQLEDFRRRQDALAAQEAETARLHAEADVLRQEWEGKVAKLRTAMGG